MPPCFFSFASRNLHVWQIKNQHRILGSVGKVSTRGGKNNGGKREIITVRKPSSWIAIWKQEELYAASQAPHKGYQGNHPCAFPASQNWTPVMMSLCLSVSFLFLWKSQPQVSQVLICFLPPKNFLFFLFFIFFGVHIIESIRLAVYKKALIFFFPSEVMSAICNRIFCSP